MKQVIALLLFSIMVISAWATIWHVNNNSGIVANYTSLQSALDSPQVVNGDTLYLYGSGTTYGAGVMTEVFKRLTIIGPGYLLSENQGLQNNTLPAVINLLVLRPGSEGSLVSGLKFADYLTVDAANVVVQRNQMRTCYVSGANCMFIQNFITDTPNYTYCLYAYDAASNLTVANCRFWGPFGTFAIYMDNNSSGSFYNNFTNGSCRFRNCNVYNNIMGWNGNGWQWTFEWDAPSYLHHNVLTTVYSWDWLASVPPMGPDNLYNVSDQIFVETGSTDGYYQLCAGSPAIGVGVDSADCGIFGGSTPYKLSGIPAIPTISEFFAPAVGFVIPVQITTRSNN